VEIRNPPAMSTGFCANCFTGNKLDGTPKGAVVETSALPAYFIPGNKAYGAQKVRSLDLNSAE
jgi:hypothetical protein